MSNATLLTADRRTHAKIVAVALIASIAVSLVGIAGHGKALDSEPLLQNTRHIVLAGSGYIVDPDHRP